MTAVDCITRWRVRLGYVIGAIVLIFARPDWRSILRGAVIGFVGLAIRAYAAGHLHKQEILTKTGPYAYTRNPLYLGSSIMAAGAAVAMKSRISAILLLVYFALVYAFVMKREEGELKLQHPGAFEAYAESVPLFVPRLVPKRPVGTNVGRFSWKQFRKNHEHEATIGFVLLLLLLVIIWRMRTA